MKSIKKLLKSWSWRGHTLIGKIQVVKSFVIPKILLSHSLSIVQKLDFVKKINSFSWKGKDKIKGATLINSIEEGDLKMLDIVSMISTQKRERENNKLKYPLRKVGTLAPTYTSLMVLLSFFCLLKFICYMAIILFVTLLSVL